jgi:hypothetical protein
VCSASTEIQSDVLEHHKREFSHKKIVEVIKEKFKYDMSPSAIGRHLKNCINQKGKITLQEKIDTTKIDESNIHDTLRHMLFEGVQKLLQRMQETVNETTSYNFHLETYKCMDLFINMLDKLSPNSASTAINKKREQTVRMIKELSSFQKRVMWLILDNFQQVKFQSLQTLKRMIDQEIRKEEKQKESQNLQNDESSQDVPCQLEQQF